MVFREGSLSLRRGARTPRNTGWSPALFPRHSGDSLAAEKSRCPFFVSWIVDFPVLLSILLSEHAFSPAGRLSAAGTGHTSHTPRTTGTPKSGE